MTDDDKFSVPPVKSYDAVSDDDYDDPPRDWEARHRVATILCRTSALGHHDPDFDYCGSCVEHAERLMDENEPVRALLRALVDEFPHLAAQVVEGTTTAKLLRLPPGRPVRSQLRAALDEVRTAVRGRSELERSEVKNSTLTTLASAASLSSWLPDELVDLTMRAFCDPGQFTPRGADKDDGTSHGERINLWQRRALALALAADGGDGV